MKEQWDDITVAPTAKFDSGKNEFLYKKPKKDDFDLDDMIITDEMNAVLDIIAKDEFKMLFMTGRAGTGKSVFLKYLKNKVLKNAVFVAPTGIASINIQGQTIHSFFKFGHQFQSHKNQGFKDDASTYKKMKYLVIDEISMVRADIFDSINTLLQVNRNNKGEVFGGVKVIIFGDLFQLPPIVGNEDKNLFKKFNYKTPYFFSSDIFKSISSKVQYIEFSKIFRQNEMKYINILENIRHSKLPKNINTQLNERVIEKYDDVPAGTMVLATLNKISDNYNQKFLSELESKSKTYFAEIKGNFRLSDFPTKEELVLKVGAQIMFVKNDAMKRYVNGTIGTITYLADDHINVDVDGYDIRVIQDEWEKIEYTSGVKEINDGIATKPVGTFKQFPVKLGWSVSIHKSQGLTFDRVLIDTGNRVFAPGQIYVALSRCKTYGGLYLRYPIQKKDLIQNAYITAFLEYINNMKIEVKQIEEEK